MPRYTVTDPTSGKTIVLTGDSPPTEAELTEIFAHVNGKPRGYLDTALDVAKGVAKGAGRTALDLGELVGSFPVNLVSPMAGNIRTAVDQTYQKPGLSRAAFAGARDATEYTNAPQMAGGTIEALAELALPMTKGAQAIPTAAKAGAKFKSVMSAAGHLPVEVNAPGTVALRIQQLADRGASMPMAVRKFLARITDPNKGAFNYEEARDFASAISRLSANERQRLTPAVAREVANLRVTLNEAVAKTAKSAGKEAEHRSAMREYAQAMRIRDAVDALIEGAKKGAPYASAAGAGYWGASKLKALFENAPE